MGSGVGLLQFSLGFVVTRFAFPHLAHFAEGTLSPPALQIFKGFSILIALELLWVSEIGLAALFTTKNGRFRRVFYRSLGTFTLSYAALFCGMSYIPEGFRLYVFTHKLPLFALWIVAAVLVQSLVRSSGFISVVGTAVFRLLEFAPPNLFFRLTGTPKVLRLDPNLCQMIVLCLGNLTSVYFIPDVMDAPFFPLLTIPGIVILSFLAGLIKIQIVGRQFQPF